MDYIGAEIFRVQFTSRTGLSGTSFHKNNKTCQRKIKIEGNKEKNV